MLATPPLASVFDGVAENFTFADKKSIRSIGFAFTGQGAQWARMGADLMAYCPSFLRSIRELDLVLEELTDGPEWSIEDVLLEYAETSPVSEAEFSQRPVHGRPDRRRAAARFVGHPPCRHRRSLVR